MWRKTSSLLACALGLSALERFEFAEPHMGTLVSLRLYASDAPAAGRAARAAFDRVAELEAALSDYRPDSELNRLCRAGHMRVSPDLARVLAAAQRRARESDGTFDITLAPLTKLWREARRTGKLPGEAAIAAARARCGYRRVTVRGRDVALAPGTELDLGGIGKGYAADEALAVLRRHGVRRALVALSGDIALGDPPPGECGWRVAMQGRTECLANRAVSTSGPEQQFLEVDGTRYSHILDPRTGLGLRTARTVTVIARRGMDADSWATALSAASDPEGLARRRRVSALVTRAGYGWISPSWPGATSRGRIAGR